MNNQKLNIELFSQQELLNILGKKNDNSTLQLLTYLRLGRKQKQKNNKSRTEYIYNWCPQLLQNTDWCYFRGKVFYTETGVEKIKDIFFNKKRIFRRN